MAGPAKIKPIRSVAFVSLGCPKNLVDSERMLGLLAEDGLTITNDASRADAIVVNTCGFLEASKTESLEAIREAVAMKSGGQCKRVVVAGCLVQRHKTKLLSEVPQIDRLVGVFDRQGMEIEALLQDAQLLRARLVQADPGEFAGCQFQALRHMKIDLPQPSSVGIDIGGNDAHPTTDRWFPKLAVRPEYSRLAGQGGFY